MNQDLTGKIALITGASRGIGAEAAKLLASRGATVGIHYSASEQEAKKVAAHIEHDGGKAFLIKADLAKPDSADLVLQQLKAKLAELGATKFDILVNNAGIALFGDRSPEGFDRQFAINVRSLFFLTEGAVPMMNDGGRVINLSTAVTRVYFPGITPYAATKGAVDTLTLYWAAELAPRNITVNAVAPGAINTDMSSWMRSAEGEAMVLQIQALQRKGQPKDIAEVIGFLASTASSWITGRSIEASGGTKL
jgi:3-oxoacyl-[acyl-carrier protein] reductase